MENPYDDDVSRFSVAFTRAVIAWNVAEDAARTVLISFSQHSLGMIVAAQHLGNVALKDALTTLADMTDDDDRPASQEIALHVMHLVEGMDILRVYRNFYVHSLLSIGKSPHEEGVFQGRLRAVEARGRFTWIDQNVTCDELEAFMRQCRELAEYAAGMALCLGPDNAFDPQPKKPPLSSLQKPTWPEKLKKQKRYLRER